ncbi:MAG: membrane protein insertion efficiency factor YidD [Candidatus Cardinium sp.]|uniref:membrane protein insertion efficiency factor YidD n=1 Tax=Cardinium endosymbiont of Dermatophagoides farinae TaxID=2597823 RepID=UPI001181F1A7|nr:membrane protein insertion efficiency factor YidD [Cardinium endosymbiont of Dermatophagoides farinae]TSJ80529.1 membrane protein insertion efficiency factor YidD [Cardinium endosymbiont of Dermatophagoides farinae]UWW96501.1 MAG: membrane protein insertion efficiency factor YidD [Candidatus Cardinium sp.]
MQISKFLSRFCCFAISIYQHCVAPLFPPVCRFQPSCSCYAKAAFSRYGIRKGTLLTLRRLLRCHPWGGSGYDPLL